MLTSTLSANDITRKWHLFDAQGQVLGRLATQIAGLLMGKHKTDFVRYLDIADHVVVINAAKIKVTGNKVADKLYHRHSGHPGGMKILTFSQMLAKNPSAIIQKAVTGMLPKNRLQDKILKHLHIYTGSDHPFTKQFKKA